MAARTTPNHRSDARYVIRPYQVTRRFLGTATPETALVNLIQAHINITKSA